VRTIDSFLAEIAGAYHQGLGLPEDIPRWLRERSDGYAEIAQKVAMLLQQHPMIAAALAHRYSVIVCDEHQDSSGDQHAAIMAIQRAGAKVRIFADPMQRIFPSKALVGSLPEWQWSELTASAQAFEQLNAPHRWATGCSLLGALTLRWREALKTGGVVDLRGELPPSVRIVYAENLAKRNLDFSTSKGDRRPIDAFTRSQDSLLVLTHFNDTALGLRRFFNRRMPIWEGHTRPALDQLVATMVCANRDPLKLANGVLDFLVKVGKGFGRSAFGDVLEQEIRESCTRKRRGQPAAIQELARLLMTEPDHRGVAKMLLQVVSYKDQGRAFRDVILDLPSQYWDAVSLGEYETADEGLAGIKHRRAYAYPHPPKRAISTIHRAKGLECRSAIVVPGDAKNFPVKPEARCLLYVALSRAIERLVVVLPRSDPSPLFLI